MAKNDIPKAGEFMPTELGDSIYLWKGKSANSDVMITAHGGYTLSNKPFKVPGSTSIHFLAPHGFLLNDPGLKPVATGSLTAFDSYASGSLCPNYELSKYQGSHGGSDGKPAETYADIAVKMHPEAERQLLREFKPFNLDEALASVKEIRYDVITIRNRNFHSTPDLDEVVKQLAKHGFSYSNIYCSFCRGRMGHPDEFDMSWNAREHKLA